MSLGGRKQRSQSSADWYGAFRRLQIEEEFAGEFVELGNLQSRAARACREVLRDRDRSRFTDEQWIAMLTKRLDLEIGEESIGVEQRLLRDEFDLLLRKRIAQTFVGHRRKVKGLNRKLKQSLVGVAGPVSAQSAGVWTHARTIGDWRILTEIDAGGATDAWRYSHTVTLGNAPRLSMISVLSWLGISSQTMWDLVEEDSFDHAIEQQRRLCTVFIEGFASVAEDLV